MPPSEQIARVNALTDRQVLGLKSDWEWWARPEQLIPADFDPVTKDGPWITWMILAGRGWGKTRTGAETVREWVKDNKYVNFIGATGDDARDIMIEGESGILAICPKYERPIYKAHKRCLEWPNGAKSLIFTADEPDRLRGKQHMKLWCDEMASWRYAESWDQASLGLRLGGKPQAIITTTPRPIKVIKDLIIDKTTIITKGSTFDNQSNLAAAFMSKIVSRYENTRMGRQELYAEILDDMPGALWTRTQIEKLRVQEVPRGVRLTRIVVAVDPAISTVAGSDETGIVVIGKGSDGHYYVLADRSGHYSPEEWAREVVAQYDLWKADRIIAEANQGGEMVERTIRIIGGSRPVTLVHATRGKVTRAEPVSALYEQGKVHHVGMHAVLEDQMCQFTSDFDRTRMGYSPDRVDALVWAATELTDHRVGFFG